jgi:hypothetical protein
MSDKTESGPQRFKNLLESKAYAYEMGLRIGSKMVIQMLEDGKDLDHIKRVINSRWPE